MPSASWANRVFAVLVLAACTGDDARILYTLAIMTLRGDSPKEAESLLRRVVEADPQDAYAAYFLGQALLAQGRVDEALPHFERAIALDPRLRSPQYAAAQALGR